MDRQSECARQAVPRHAGYPQRCGLSALERAFDGGLCLPRPHIHHAELNPEWLENGDNSGLICLSGAHYGEVGVNLLNGNEDAARAAALKYAAWFPDTFYLELQRLPERPEWEACVSGSVKLAEELGLPVVATHPTQFMNRDDFNAHEARVCIAGGWVLTDKKRPRDFTPSQFSFRRKRCWSVSPTCPKP